MEIDLKYFSDVTPHFSENFWNFKRLLKIVLPGLGDTKISKKVKSLSVNA